MLMTIMTSYPANDPEWAYGRMCVSSVTSHLRNECRIIRGAAGIIQIAVNKQDNKLWKVSGYGVFSGQYFSSFGMNTEIIRLP